MAYWNHVWNTIANPFWQVQFQSFGGIAVNVWGNPVVPNRDRATYLRLSKQIVHLIELLLSLKLVYPVSSTTMSTLVDIFRFSVERRVNLSLLSHYHSELSLKLLEEFRKLPSQLCLHLPLLSCCPSRVRPPLLTDFLPLPIPTHSPSLAAVQDYLAELQGFVAGNTAVLGRLRHRLQAVSVKDPFLTLPSVHTLHTANSLHPVQPVNPLLSKPNPPVSPVVKPVSPVYHGSCEVYFAFPEGNPGYTFLSELAEAVAAQALAKPYPTPATTAVCFVFALVNPRLDHLTVPAEAQLLDQLFHGRTVFVRLHWQGVNLRSTDDSLVVSSTALKQRVVLAASFVSVLDNTGLETRSQDLLESKELLLGQMCDVLQQFTTNLRF